MYFSVTRILFAFLLAVPVIASAQVKVGNNPTSLQSSAVLEMESTTKGMLPPRMTQGQMDAIVSPATGLVVYCTDCIPADLYLFDGTAFKSLAVGKATLEDGSLYCGGTLGGAYTTEQATNATNTKEVSIRIAAGGAYTIGTDTVNGVYFLASGTASSTGNRTLALRAYGTPEAAGIFNYTARANGEQSCSFTVGYAAVATFNCNNVSNNLPTNLVNGTNYSSGSFSVTAPYTTGNGVSYTATTVGPVEGLTLTRLAGTYNAAGGNVVYNLSGTYTGVSGESVSFVLPESGCTVIAKAATYVSSSLSCAGPLNGVYQKGRPLTNANTKTINVNVATTGGYSITSTLVNGVVFKADGFFAATGLQTVVLKASGIPTNSVTTVFFSYSITLGGQTCGFGVNVNPGVAFKCEEAVLNFNDNSFTNISASLVNGTYYSGTYTVPYIAGNGEPYADAVVGPVSGLSLTRPAGSYSLGGGNIVYTLDGSYSGSASSIVLTTPEGCVSSAPDKFVSTLAGSQVGYLDGTGAAARFNSPEGICTDASGNLYVADKLNHRIRKITPEGVVTTVAGNGTIGSTNGNGASVSFNYPTGIAIDKSGNLYVTETTGSSRIRKITPAGDVTTFTGGAGTGNVNGSLAVAKFDSPSDIVIDDRGDMYIADYGNNTIRAISSGAVTNFAGSALSGYVDGFGGSARFFRPQNLAIDKYRNLYVTEAFNNKSIRKISAQRDVTTLAGDTSTLGVTDGPSHLATFHSPTGIAVNKSGMVYVVESSFDLIRKIDPNLMYVTTLAGSTAGSIDGQYHTAKFNQPYNIAIDASGNIYISERDSHRIRKISP
jgi:sugar lactone lactonase YvrE